ncbi:Sip1-related alpha-galactosidase [Infirmifilum sp. NZ]|uniref:Sip1-related alpha-galactosidase n=1 Tax=Infirmifilum sp. NZ TaxID=2926850 RepID=UPI0027A5A80E|nr:Sip1-related alpha-galactosidase [Infirmifilum sp. NZ]UNQ73235.1 alpha-galactosidase [Infirmifilum sp. NZ]
MSPQFKLSVARLEVSTGGFLKEATPAEAYLTEREREVRVREGGVLAARLLLLKGSGVTTPEGVAAVADVKLPRFRRALVFHHTYDSPGYMGGTNEPYDYPQAQEVGEFMASPWTFPWHTEKLSGMPRSLKINQLMLEVEEGFVFVLCVPADGFAPYFTEPAEGVLRLVVTSRARREWMEAPLLAYALSEDPYSAVEAVYKAVASHLGRTCSLRSSKPFSEPLRFLGWCTWNAFWRDVNQEKLVEGAREIMAKAPVRMVLLDDGWMEEKDGMLRSFDEDREKFPDGLAYAVSRLRQSGARSVGIWLTLNGYWNGIHPESHLAHSFREELEEVGGLLVPKPESSFRFYSEWFRLIKSKGFDFIKVDNQYAVSTVYSEKYPVGDASRMLHEAIEAAAALHGLDVLNCMSLNPEHFFNWFRSNVTRASIDYSVPHSSSRSKLHLYFNAYNSIWLSQLAWPDWDMFQSYDPLALPHAVARAISGGPIYVTDEPGKTRAEVLKPLVFDSGEIPSLDGPALPTRDTVMLDPYNEKVALKLANSITVPGLGVYHLLAAFNIYKGDEEVSYTFKPKELGAREGKVVVYEYFSNQAVKVGVEEDVAGKLEPGGVRLYVISPVRDGLSVIGTRQLYVSPAVIARVDRGEGELTVYLKERKPVLLYLEESLAVDGAQIEPGLREVIPRSAALRIRLRR